jgi:hypothetical protein
MNHKNKSSVILIYLLSCSYFNLARMNNKHKTPLWESKGFFISVISMLLMLIVLALLPPYTDRFSVHVTKDTAQCKFRIVVSDGEKVMPVEKFDYSSDSGKTFQPLNEFTLIAPGQVNIAVKEKGKKHARFDFTESPSFFFNAACNDTCDCKYLKVVSVSWLVLTSSHKALIIHASKSLCGLEYSVSGAEGPYKKDSIFMADKPDGYNIFIRTSKCGTPVAYYDNPFPKPPAGQHAYQTRPPASDGTIYDVDQIDRPIYPAGEASYDNINSSVSESARKSGSTGTIRVTIIVETDGTVYEINFSGGVSSDAQERIRAAIKSYGNWSTGYKNGQPVRTRVPLIVSL